MERIKVYRGNNWLSKFWIAIGAFLLIAGFLFLVKSVLQNSSLELYPITFLIQGILFIFIGYLNIRSGRYFIEWDESQVRYFLPNNQSIETIEFSEIRNVKIALFKIQLELESTGEKTIDLENLQFGQIQKVKQMFETIKEKHQGAEDIRSH